MQLTKSDRIRFIDKTGFRQPNGCVLWIGGRCGQNTYGRFYLNGRKEGAHRVAYLIEYGPFDESLEVAHTCDNPLCVRPDHLFLTNHVGNIQDCLDKGRFVLGEDHPMAQVSDLTCDLIRLEYAKGGITHRELAEIHGISRVQVTRIINRTSRA